MTPSILNVAFPVYATINLIGLEGSYCIILLCIRTSDWNIAFPTKVFLVPAPPVTNKWSGSFGLFFFLVTMSFSNVACSSFNFHLRA